MIKINLLPVREARRKADLQQQLMLFGALVAVAVGVIAWLHVSIRADIAEAERSKVQIQAQIKKYDAQVQQVKAYKKKKEQVQQKLDVIDGLERSRSGPVRILDELALHTPERMWLTHLKSEGRQLELEGMSLDNEIVAVFLTELNNSPYFTDVELQRTELSSSRGLKLNRFQVSATMQERSEEESGGEGAQSAGRSAGAGAAGR